MRKQTNQETELSLPLSDAFAALKVLSSGHLLTGLDEWRHSTGRDSLSSFDENLVALIRKQPPSKFGPTNQPSVWTATHFLLALPTLTYALKKYGQEDAHISKKRFAEAEIARYVIAFPYIIRHYREYQDFTKRFGIPSDDWWDTTLDEAFGGLSNRTSLNGLIKKLPPYLFIKTNKVLSNQEDSLVGRIVLAYLLNKDISPEALRVDKRALRFLDTIGDSEHQAKSLYERLKHAQTELAGLEPFLNDYDPQKGLELGLLLEVVRWYGRPHLVEMIIPGLIGAAEPAFQSLRALFNKVIEDGGPDYTHPNIHELPSIIKFRETQSLTQIGRLSLIKDIASSDAQKELSDGAVIRRVASDIYSEAERLTAWGNSRYYIPDTRTSRQPFSVFRQDIADILFCAGLVVEADAFTDIPHPDDLKLLAVEVKKARSIKQIRQTVQAHHCLLADLVADWEERYPGHERLRIIRFVLQTFGLAPTRPVPIPLTGINKSFLGSYYDGQAYHLRYQEANEHVALTIPLPKPSGDHSAVRYQVTYHTIDKQDRSLPVTVDGIPYAAWLEIDMDDSPIIIPVPSRGTFDPFGRPDSLHAGEVVGFGCSVHHAGLVVALCELAALGATDASLKKVKNMFMRINRGMHERLDLSDYQLAQVISAFRDHHMLSITDYLHVHPEVAIDSSRPYLKTYLSAGKKSVGWAEPQAARLAFGYPDLYPYRSATKINPRCIWYDGQSFEITSKASLNWQQLRAVGT